MKISNMLKEKRKEYQLTQEELAEKIFVSSKTISNWENDKTKPDIESLILLAKLFDLSLDNLLLEESDMVKSIDKDIKKGRNLKKILFMVTAPLLIIILILSWFTYRGEHRSIVPLEDFSTVEVIMDGKEERLVRGQIALKQFETISLADTSIVDGVMYIMVYKDPRLFSKENKFVIDVDQQLTSYRMSYEELEKITLVYFDVKEYQGYGWEELQNQFPKKTIWEKTEN